MAEKKGKKPDYSGNGIAIWRNKDKNGNDYLTVQIFGENGLGDRGCATGFGHMLRAHGEPRRTLRSEKGMRIHETIMTLLAT